MQTYSQGQLEKAQKFIDELRRENGGITKEDRQFLKREKPDILRSFDNIRRKLGSSTQILAEQLYQKSTRFVYELIKNAEDNKYTSSTDFPCLSFTLQEDRVIIDSNEDGFTQRDIKAICSIGESTKASIQGYIGEKGIGFKSVFNVAYKVHIQSEPYSFAFEYRKGDSVDLRIKTAITGTITSVISRSFWVKKRHVINLPADSARRQIHEAEVVLAFPIDEDYVSVIKEEYAFAFLPLKKVGYKFLIQSDFITKASREDIVDSAWNRKLIEEVVATFCSAINGPNGFLQNETLRYSWVRYIPTTAIADEFWGLLQPRLFAKLCTSPNAYVSESHDNSDISILKEMKVRYLSDSEFLQRLNQDLAWAFASRMQSTPLDSPWHTKVANLLIVMCINNSIKKEIQKLNIIPLDNLAWVRPLNASIFFPTSGGVDIPKGLPLNLVDEKALENPSREKLFSQLGVSECSPERIFPLIQQRSFPTVRKFLASDLQDIRFLFWHHGELASDYPINMWLWNGESYSVASPQKDGSIYFPQCENTYALANLFGKSVPLELMASNNVRYIVSNYCQIFESCGFRNGLTGIEWLRSIGMKETPQLRASNSKGHLQSPEISAELKYIAEKFPGFLLGVLQANFIQYHKSEKWDRFFRQKNVPILASLEMRSLNYTFLPLPKLKAIASSLELEEGFGFLRELDGISASGVIEWNFLKRFAVGVDEDVSFWLRLLEQARRKNPISPSIVFRIYSRLQSYVDESDIIKIKEAFEEQMVFVLSSNSMDDWKWKYDDDCVWSGPEWFEYKPRLQAIKEYQTLQALFVNTVGISDATLADFLEYLRHIKFHFRNKSKCNFKKEKYKIILLYDKLNELTEDGKSSEEIEEVRYHLRLGSFFTTLQAGRVYRPSQEVEWLDSTGNFAIVDRKEHGDASKNKINMLDFSLEEVHSINQFLIELGLEGRFTSRAVKEDPKIEDGLLSDGLTKDLRRKAYAICRYAAHYGSNNPRSAYDLLQTLEVFTSESITKEVSITQNKKIISVKVHTAFLHIAQDNNQLKLYVPKEQRQMEVCLSRQLPIELLKHLGVPNFRKGAELGSVIRATSSFAIDAILDSDGIIDVPGIFPPDDYSESEPPAFDASQDISGPAINTDVESRVTLLEPHYRDELSTEYHFVRAQLIDSSLRMLATPGTHPPEIPPERPDLFNELLDAVIKQARSVHGIPAVDDVLIAALSTNARIDTSLAVGSNVAGESLFRIGMFKIMKSLGLPLFDLGNWRSTIRHRVTIHNEYKYMPRWSGSETSDIVYEDHDKMLTSLLITNNYFNIEELARLRFASSPTYYVEVKTTPGPLDNAFYCSQGQFDRMESMKLQPDQLVSEVYLVSRVFNLGASGMGFKLYVDPAGLRRKGQLKFTADKYVVTS
ncbi:hypothetical protein BTUL_0061g00190 [Botrytis tulipae]|uniref:Protein NO VEIN C-terminal domain-containing protein n=1 Tax=Botrytis tulipae TaxID=87230 RepID=A0A4Z1ESW5_9HELO|nr:hypothetical protein BTUL_0061g00190 [Botrytis tulipae]